MKPISCKWYTAGRLCRYQRVFNMSKAVYADKEKLSLIIWRIDPSLTVKVNSLIDYLESIGVRVKEEK